jgi:hypothetical protein
MRNFFLVALLLSVHAAAWSWSDPTEAQQIVRPRNVPSDAVFVQLEKSGVWQRCSIEPATGFVRCQIFSEKGRTEHDESFFPYDEGPTVQPSELTVASKDPDAGLHWICLNNGRILMPGSRYDYVKAVLDKKLSKARKR